MEFYFNFVFIEHILVSIDDQNLVFFVTFTWTSVELYSKTLLFIFTLLSYVLFSYNELHVAPCTINVGRENASA